MMVKTVGQSTVLDYETDKDTHFKCPHCGQKGSVPTATLEKALEATPHVHISCSSCQKKFEPFAEIVTAGDENILPHNIGDTAGDAQIEKEEKDQGLSLPPLADHFHAAQEAELGDDNSAQPADGSLPSWMMPPPAENPDDNSFEKTQVPDKDASSKAMQATTLDAATDNDAALIDDIAAYRPPQDDTDTPLHTPSETTKDDRLNEGDSEEVPDAEPINEMSEADFSADSDTQIDEIFPIEDEEHADTPLPEDKDLSMQIADMDRMRHMSEPAEMPNSTPSLTPRQAPRSNGPMGIVNGLLLLLVIGLVAVNIHVLMQEDTGRLNTASLINQNDATGLLRVQTAEFQIDRSPQGTRAIISIRFNNDLQEDAIIGDYRIHLENDQGQSMASWTELSRGQKLSPGKSKTVTSVLVDPPANIARVSVDYPPRD